MKQPVRLISAVLLAAAVLAGCGSTQSAAVSSSAEDSGAAAGSTTENSGTQVSGDAAETAATQASEDTAQAAAGSSNTLIVYFDYSENMGDTSGMDTDAITSASLAGQSYNGVDRNDLLVMKDEIQKQTGADVFSVRVTEPYDPDYNTMVGVAQEDQDNNKQFTFVEDLPDLSGYDVIYMGMPVWWGGLPQPMVCLLDQYDFSDKIIIPFGINLGSGFGRMITQIEDAEPGAIVNENGLTENSHTPNSEVIDDVDSWLNSLN